MNIRLSFAFVVVVLFWPLLCIISDPLTMIILYLGVGISLTPLLFAQKDEICYAFALFTAGSIFLGYWMRVPLILSTPEFFAYPHLGIPTIQEIRSSVLKTCLMTIPFCLGAGLPLIRPLKDAQIRFASHSVTSFQIRAHAGNFLSYLYNARYLILALGFTVLFLRVVVIKAFGVGMMSGEKEFGFLERLLPSIPLLFAACTLFILYGRRLRFFDILVSLAYVLSTVGFILMSGSKAGLAYAMLAIAVVMLLRLGDMRLKIKYIVFGLAGIAIMVFFIFPYTQALRNAMSKEGTGFGTGFVEAFQYYIATFDAWNAINFFSARMIGLDGTIALNFPQTEILRTYFSPQGIGLCIAQTLLPGIHFGQIPLGRYVGMTLTGHSIYVQHSGSVGFFASMELLFGGPWTYIALFFAGLLWSGLFRVFWNLFYKSDFKYYMAAMYMFVALRMMLSGNFDIITILFIQNVLQSMEIVMTIWLLMKLGAMRQATPYIPQMPLPGNRH